MMKWQTLINDKRFGLEHYKNDKRAEGRTDFRRDYDRLVFSSPFRRLQNKTQVFPLPGSIFVHNRLTHSLEVSSVGRSLADAISHALHGKYAEEPWVGLLDDMGDIVASACLAHDLGNPPFGHSGEKTISSFFREGAGMALESQLSHRQWLDLINFEGNANAFRLLTHQFNGRRQGGFAMTYTMLASIVKYPFDSTHAGEKGKFGFFESEREDFVRVADTLGMLRMPQADGSVVYARHPLVYIVEAADDICYEVMDMEDAHKLKILTTNQVKEVFLRFLEPKDVAHAQEVMDCISDPNEKVSYMRSIVIGALVNACARVFIDNEEKILAGEFEGTLLEHLPNRLLDAYQHSAQLSTDKIYCAKYVVDIDLAGNRILTFLLEKLTHAVIHPDQYYSKLLLSQVPQQYDVMAESIYDRVLAVVDHVSAMTDVYALNLYRQLNGHSLPAV